MRFHRFISIFLIIAFLLTTLPSQVFADNKPDSSDIQVVDSQKNNNGMTNIQTTEAAILKKLWTNERKK